MLPVFAPAFRMTKDYSLLNSSDATGNFPNAADDFSRHTDEGPVRIEGYRAGFIKLMKQADQRFSFKD